MYILKYFYNGLIGGMQTKVFGTDEELNAFIEENQDHINTDTMSITELTQQEAEAIIKYVTENIVNKVFVVFDGYKLDEVFSTEDKAKDYIEEQKSNRSECYYHYEAKEVR